MCMYISTMNFQFIVMYVFIGALYGLGWPSRLYVSVLYVVSFCRMYVCISTLYNLSIPSCRCVSALYMDSGW